MVGINFMNFSLFLITFMSFIQRTLCFSRCVLLTRFQYQIVSNCRLLDLYFDFVAPTLQQDILTETWQNGGGNLPSNCSGPYSVNNIESISLTSNINFPNKKDHSKWAVTPAGGQFTCIGDINRQVKIVLALNLYFLKFNFAAERTV